MTREMSSLPEPVKAFNDEVSSNALYSYLLEIIDFLFYKHCTWLRLAEFSFDLNICILQLTFHTSYNNVIMHSKT